MNASRFSALHVLTVFKRNWRACVQVVCGICYDEHPADSVLAGPCHHAYCTECWHGYVSTAIASGPACLDLRCPDPECKVAVSS